METFDSRKGSRREVVAALAAVAGIGATVRPARAATREQLFDLGRYILRSDPPSEHQARIEAAFNVAFEAESPLFGGDGVTIHSTQSVPHLHEVRTYVSASVQRGDSTWKLETSDTDVSNLFVDISGRDDNDGVSSSAPLRSIGRAFSIINSYGARRRGLWKVWISAGTFVVDDVVNVLPGDRGRRVEIRGARNPAFVEAPPEFHRSMTFQRGAYFTSNGELFRCLDASSGDEIAQSRSPKYERLSPLTIIRPTLDSSLEFARVSGNHLVVYDVHFAEFNKVLAASYYGVAGLVRCHTRHCKSILTAAHHGNISAVGGEWDGRDVNGEVIDDSCAVKCLIGSDVFLDQPNHFGLSVHHFDRGVILDGASGHIDFLTISDCLDSGLELTRTGGSPNTHRMRIHRCRVGVRTYGPWADYGIDFGSDDDDSACTYNVEVCGSGIEYDVARNRKVRPWRQCDVIRGSLITVDRHTEYSMWPRIQLFPPRRARGGDSAQIKLMGTCRARSSQSSATFRLYCMPGSSDAEPVLLHSWLILRDMSVWELAIDFAVGDRDEALLFWGLLKTWDVSGNENGSTVGFGESRIGGALRGNEERPFRITLQLEAGEPHVMRVLLGKALSTAFG